MRTELEGKIFVIHHVDNMPALAFLSPFEANRVEKELNNMNLHFSVREIFCFGNVLQRLFVLMETNNGTGPISAFIKGKDANCMSKLMGETGNEYTVTEITCFSIMREQVLAKYKLKFLNHLALNEAING